MFQFKQCLRPCQIVASALCTQRTCSARWKRLTYADGGHGHVVLAQIESIRGDVDGADDELRVRQLTFGHGAFGGDLHVVAVLGQSRRLKYCQLFRALQG